MKVLHTHLTMITILLVLVSPSMIPTILYAQTGDWLEMFILQSNSMAPALHYHDKVLVDILFPYERLKVGDIIAFKTFGINSTGQHETILHRIAQEVIDKNGDRIIRTKGDANNDSIPSLDYPIFQQNYIGKAFYRITAGNVIGDNNTILSIGGK
jgi:signal peptidase I